MAFMPWNFETVQKMYPSTAEGYLHRVGDRWNLNPQAVANRVRSLVKEDGADPSSEATLARARELTAGEPSTARKYMSPTFGYLAQWISEVGGKSDLDVLLRHADTYLNPSWIDGGLYYARCDDGWDADGNFTYVDPYTGNAGIGYARLNVKEGQKKMWEHPWTKEVVESTPWIDGLGLERGVDCLRGVWDDEERAMLVSLRTWDGSVKSVQLLARNLPCGRYGIYQNGELQHVAEVAPLSEPLVIDLKVSGDELDLVVLKE
jgi:hypothetical protein